MSEESGNKEEGAGGVDPELQDLAKRYLDLWQDQMTALASDNEFVAAWRKMAEAMGAGQAFAQLNQAGGPAGAQLDPTALFRSMMAGAAMPNRETGDEPGQDSSGTTPGSQTSAASPDSGSDDLELIARRLALLEERVAKLESKPKAARKRASGGTRSKKS